MCRQWLDVAISHSKSPIGSVSISAYLFVGQKQMTDILDIEVFFRALGESGRYPLFTCGCGCFGCGGYYVDVRCVEDAWIMQNRFHPHDENKLLESFEYRFHWENVYIVATRIKDYIKRILEEFPGALLASGTSEVFNASAILANQRFIDLREERGNHAWFENYYALIVHEAARLGNAFRWHSEESNSVVWSEKELEMCDASGWLLEPEEVAVFDRCEDAFYNSDGPESEELYKYYPRLRSVFWSMKMDGTIMIEFGPEEGD